MAPIAGDYDVVVVDCPPASNLLVRAALGLAHYAVIPTKIDDVSIDGLDRARPPPEAGTDSHDEPQPQAVGDECEGLLLKDSDGAHTAPLCRCALTSYDTSSPHRPPVRSY